MAMTEELVYEWPLVNKGNISISITNIYSCELILLSDVVQNNIPKKPFVTLNIIISLFGSFLLKITIQANALIMKIKCFDNIHTKEIELHK